jgi:hypothetical protein
MQGFMGMFGTWLSSGAQQQMSKLLDRHEELASWLAVKDELHRRIDKERTVLGALERQRNVVRARLESVRRDLAAHMERKP